MKILFLCHGNICRSPMAEFVMKDLLAKAGQSDILVESAALHTDEIGSDIHAGTREMLRRHGIPFAPRAAWLLDAAKAKEYDLLIGMDAYNIADLKRRVYPEDRNKIHLLMEYADSNREVADPWYTGDFEATWNDVTAGCEGLLKNLVGPRADFSIVLVRPEIPHNTGAIGRLAVGLGVPLHLIRPLGFHLDDRAIARAGLDYWPHLKVTVHDTWEDYVATVRPERLHFLSTHGEKSLYDCRFVPGDALVFGNESSGLPKPFYSTYHAQLFRIPMPGSYARSINLANAVSIAAYECYRQCCAVHWAHL